MSTSAAAEPAAAAADAAAGAAGGSADTGAGCGVDARYAEWPRCYPVVDTRRRTGDGLCRSTCAADSSTSIAVSACTIK